MLARYPVLSLSFLPQCHSHAWQKFNRSIGGDGSVGIWHETYLVRSGQYEAIYANMPIFGLAAATKHLPATESKETKSEKY